MDLVQDAREFIESVLLDSSGVFAPRSFEASATIYRVALQPSFLETLINSVEADVNFGARPGRHRYQELLRWLGQLTGHSPCFWFYLCHTSTDKASLSWVREARFEAGGDFNAPLGQFEHEPVPPGGAAYLGLLGRDGKWLLLHTYYPGQEFEISIHGTNKLCSDLSRFARTTGCELE